MAGTDALTGARYPGSSDSPNVSQDIQNAVNDLSDIVGGIFTTISARDTAFSTWVAQGNTMRDGLECRVGGNPQVYRGGSWHGVGAILYQTTTMDGTLWTSTHTVATLAIPDPLFPYKLMVGACVDLAQLGVGVHARAVVTVNGTQVNPAGFPAFNDTGATTNDTLTYLPTPGVSATLSGASTVNLNINKEAGAAGNGYQVSTGVGAQFNILWAQVTPT